MLAQHAMGPRYTARPNLPRATTGKSSYQWPFIAAPSPCAPFCDTARYALLSCCLP